MSQKYKAPLGHKPYFVTIGVTHWVDLFTRDAYRQIILDSLAHCQQHKGLVVHAWVIMSNHLHLIVSTAQDGHLPNIMRDFKKFTSVSLARAIEANPQESRKQWLLRAFAGAAKQNLKHEKYQVWQEGYHPIELTDSERTAQRLKYLHKNPVRAGWVLRPEDYLYSSAAVYSGIGDVRLSLDMLL